MDKKNAKRKTVIDQTRLLNEVKHLAGRHLTQLQVAEIRRAVSNTGKYAVPIFYIRVHGDEREAIVKRSNVVRDKIKALAKQGMYVTRTSCTHAEPRLDLTHPPASYVLRRAKPTHKVGRESTAIMKKGEMEEIRAMVKKVELPKLEWEMDKILASLDLTYRTMKMPTSNELACSSEELSSSDEYLPPGTKFKSKKRPRKPAVKQRIATKKAKLA